MSEEERDREKESKKASVNDAQVNRLDQFIFRKLVKVMNNKHENLFSDQLTSYCF